MQKRRVRIFKLGRLSFLFFGHIFPNIAQIFTKCEMYAKNLLLLSSNVPLVQELNITSIYRWHTDPNPNYCDLASVVYGTSPFKSVVVDLMMKTINLYDK